MSLADDSALAIALTPTHPFDLNEFLQHWQQTIVSLGDAGVTLATSLQDLPQTAAELAQEMPKIAHRLRYRAGVRLEDAPRSDADVIKLFAKIPGTSKLEWSELKIRQFLANKHGSHVIPRSWGGSNAADNILWEVGADNLRRGARPITLGEHVYIHVYNAVDSIVKNSATIAKLGLMSTGTAMLTQAIVTSLAYSLDLYRGDITVEVYRDKILAEAATTGLTAPIFFLIFIAVLALFPEFAALLATPIVLTGLNALFAIGIATPLVQSLIRHIQAGGLGNDVAAEYQSWVDSAHYLAESATYHVTHLFPIATPSSQA